MSRQDIAEVFVELVDTLVEDFDVMEFLQSLTERCVELLEATSAGIMLADQQGHLQLVAGTFGATLGLELFELQTHQGPCVDAFTTGQELLNIDLRGSHRTWPDFTAAALAAGVRTTSALPLRLRGRVLGAMNLFSDRHDALSRSSLALGQAMADVATMGLLKQRPHREQAVLSEQLQRALRNRTTIEQAKGVLATHAGISVTEAFAQLRQHSRRTGTPLHEVAESVISGTLRPDTAGPTPAATSPQVESRRTGAGNTLPTPSLAELDVQILRMIEAGVSTLVLAQTLHLHIGQVAERLVAMRTALHVGSTAAAVAVARRHGFLDE